MLKKISALFVAVVLMIVCGVTVLGAEISEIPDTSILPTVEGHRDALSYYDFEADASAEKWTYYSGAERSKEFSHGGDYSVKLVPTNGSSTYLAQNARGDWGDKKIIVGATYQFSAWVYRPEDNGTFRFGVEYYGGGKYLNGIKWSVDTVAGSWSQVSTTFVVPKDTTSITAYLWLVGDETALAYVDDVSLRMVAPPISFSMKTDQVYYYTNSDVTTGTVKLIANSDVFPDDYKSWTADISLLDGEAELFSKKGMPFTEEELELDFSLSLLSDPSKTYTVRACVKASDGTVLQTEEKSIYRKFPRPSMMDKEGRFYVNGEEFMPVIGYHVYDRGTWDDYDEAKALGVNVVQACYGMTKDPDKVIAELDKLQGKGFMALVCLYVGADSGWSESLRDATETLIPLIKDHPALFGYCLIDEPAGKNTDISELAGAYEFIRTTDSVHPLYVCDQRAAYAETISLYNDIIGFDCYPYGWNGKESHISNVLQSADFYTQNIKKPIVTILQFFQHSNYPYFPSADEMRNMLYQNYLSGAKGVGLYAIGSEKVTDSETGESISNLLTPTADALRAWADAEKEIVSDHFVYGKGTVLGQEKTDNVWWRYWQQDRCRYLLVLNRTSSPLETRITNNAFYEKDVLEVIGGGDAKSVVSTGNGYFDLSLPASGAIMYKIDEIELASGTTSSGCPWRLYVYMGDVYVEVENKITYTKHSFTIENDIITETMRFEPVGGIQDAEISELTDGKVKIKAGKGSTALYKLVDADGLKPVPFNDDYTVTTDITSGQEVSCNGYASAYTIIALYDESGFLDCKMSTVGEKVSMVIPDNISELAYLKVFRWDKNLVPLTTLWEVK